ncbi:MAG: HAD hydrolase family protein [Ruminococcus flavefaciens]|nr:HAD hydrolase family protein [Ruminococcus flavefaciens]
MKYELFVMDVDGTLTDGKIYMSGKGEMYKAFDIKDGYGIKHILPEMGIVPAIITGRESDIVQKRAEELGVELLYQKVADKLCVLKKLAKEHGCLLDEVIYVGDDINDLQCLLSAGFSACPADSAESVQNAADYVASRNGGDGAVREIIDYLYGIWKKNIDNRNN